MVKAGRTRGFCSHKEQPRFPPSGSGLAARSPPLTPKRGDGPGAAAGLPRAEGRSRGHGFSSPCCFDGGSERLSSAFVTSRSEFKFSSFRFSPRVPGLGVPSFRGGRGRFWVDTAFPGADFCPRVEFDREDLLRAGPASLAAVDLPGFSRLSLIFSVPANLVGTQTPPRF